MLLQLWYAAARMDAQVGLPVRMCPMMGMMAPHLEGHWGHHPQSCIILPPVCSVGIPATVIRFLGHEPPL